MCAVNRLTADFGESFVDKEMEKETTGYPCQNMSDEVTESQELTGENAQQTTDEAPESGNGNEAEEKEAEESRREDPCHEKALEDAVSEEELNRLKSWLFKENVRIISAAKELEQMQIQFAQEKEQFKEEMKALNRKMEAEKERLKDNTLFFEKKMEILKGGFAELDMDRRRLEKEWARLEAQKEVMQQPVYGGGRDVSDLFRGVKNQLALKKRYKDLIKIFHPDNVAGDKEMIQKINKEYENLKHEYDIGKWA